MEYIIMHICGHEEAYDFGGTPSKKTLDRFTQMGCPACNKKLFKPIFPMSDYYGIGFGFGLALVLIAAPGAFLFETELGNIVGMIIAGLGSATIGLSTFLELKKQKSEKEGDVR
jgi:hypothetical protein